MKQVHDHKFESIDVIMNGYKNASYICSQKIATTLYIAYHLDKPILIEGPAGVGKTELAKVMAVYLGVPVIRLQCYEGLDESKALYEWKYGKQLLYTQILKDKMSETLQGADGLDEAMAKLHEYDDLFFSKHFLEPRPLLKAIQAERGTVLLIDEVDKSDEEFEAFLLEILSDFQVSIPEIGTVDAVSKPFVFLTSNSTRDMSEALKRRCLYLYIPFPEPKLEREIVKVRVPGISERLNQQLVSFIQQVRNLDIKKTPSVSETIDWAKALLLLHASDLTPELIRETINVFSKYEEDTGIVQEHLPDMMRKTQAEFKG